MTIKIVDYGLGNLNSIKNILKKIGYYDVQITSSAKDLSQADFYILPGVGRFDTGINQLKVIEGFEVLKENVLQNNIPVLGICLGMQLLGNGSEEGREKGLGWLDFSCQLFSSDNNLKVPHMGWNYANLLPSNNMNAQDEMLESPRFYFVHSYYSPAEANDVLWMMSDYEGVKFASGVKKGHIMGVQFHPEKSHYFGMELLKKILKNYEK